MSDALNTVVEMSSYLAVAKKLFSPEERTYIINFLAENPAVGSLMKGTGGIRKVRIAFEHTGKSGAARVVHYFMDEDAPVFILYAFAKNEQENLTDDQKAQLKKITTAIKAAHKKGKGDE